MTTAKWKLKHGTTWHDKLHQVHPNHGKVVAGSDAQRKRGLNRILIPKPIDIDALIRKIPKGRVATIGDLRDCLGHAAGADTACPLTTGICLRIVAEAAEEARAAGKKRLTPYWRVVDNRGRLRDKFPGGVAAQATKLRGEGLSIGPAKGKQAPAVENLTAIRFHWK